MALLMGTVAQALGRMPSPVPPGADKAPLFNENYKMLLDGASQDGWYQSLMFLNATEQRANADFGALGRTPVA